MKEYWVRDRWRNIVKLVLDINTRKARDFKVGDMYYLSSNKYCIEYFGSNPKHDPEATHLVISYHIKSKYFNNIPGWSTGK